jgi:sugar O-acyltransferase (sialic acid O-acetyltransferase NeuD family)
MVSNVGSSAFLIGAGGHALVVADALRECGTNSIEHFVDSPNHSKLTPTVVPRSMAELANRITGSVHIAIGENDIRSRFCSWIDESHHELVSVIHPRAVVSRSAKIGLGTFIAAGAVVGPNVHLGKCVVINSSAVVEHDSVVGDFGFLGPGAIVGGSTVLGEGCFLGMNASVQQGTQLGTQTVVGANSFVRNNTPARSFVAGIPAKIRRVREDGERIFRGH